MTRGDSPAGLAAALLSAGATSTSLTADRVASGSPAAWEGGPGLVPETGEAREPSAA